MAIQAVGFTASGSPVGGYVANTTYAALPSATLYPVGSRAFATDIGPSGSVFTSDGTNWMPENGRILLSRSAVPYGVAPTGTLGTGTSGQLTLGTALPTTYSVGIWLYLPAIASTPAISAGLYWCVFSNTTTATIYSNGPGSAALNISASPGAYTGSTSEVTFITYTLPANLMGTNGQLIENFIGAHPSNANAKTYRHRWNGAGIAWGTTAVTTSLAVRGTRTISNRNSASLQVGINGSAFGAQGSANQYGTIDTTSSVSITLTGQIATATDYIILEAYSLELLR